MRQAAHLLKKNGFTLVELIVVMAIIGIIAAFSTPYLYGAKEKTLLLTERDKIVDYLKMAQQNAIAAKGGYDYQVHITKPGTIIFTPEVQPDKKKVELSPQVEITSISNPAVIKFARLTGKPNFPLNLTLATTRFQCQISLDQEGVISATNLVRI